MLERDRRRQRVGPCPALADQREVVLDGVLEPFDRQAGSGERLVVAPVLAAVHRLLADETLDLVLQLRRTDAVAIVPYGVDEELLAFREKDGECVEEMRDVQSLRMPGPEIGLLEIEAQVAANDVQRFGRVR